MAVHIALATTAFPYFGHCLPRYAPPWNPPLLMYDTLCCPPGNSNTFCCMDPADWCYHFTFADAVCGTGERLFRSEPAMVEHRAATGEIVIVPDPARERIKLITGNDATPTAGSTVSVLDALGREVLRATYTAEGADISSLSPGTYLVLLRDSNNGFALHARFVKEQ